MDQLAEKKALEYFNSHNCCQAVLRTVLEEKGLMFDEAVFVCIVNLSANGMAMSFV